MWKNSKLISHVIHPNNVSIQFFIQHILCALRLDIICLIHVGPIISVFETFNIKAHHFTLICNYIHHVTLNRRGRTDSNIFPVTNLPSSQLWYDQLPLKITAFLIETHHHPTVSFLTTITGRLIISSGKNPPIGNGYISVGLGSKFGYPLNVGGGFHIYGFIIVHFPGIEIEIEIFLEGHHITSGVSSPGGPIGGENI